MDGEKQGGVTRDQLQAAFDDVLAQGESAVRDSAPRAVAVGGAAALGIISLAYLAGRRRGRKRTAVLEVRRI